MAINLSNEIVNTRYNGYVFGKNKMVRVINWFKNPKKLLFRMNLEYGDYIDASKDHKILVYDMEHDCHVETPLRDISIGDYIICRRHRINSACEPIKILPFTYILNEHNNSNRLFIPNKIPTHLTEELAYILGIIYGDGCVYDDAIEIAFSNSWPEIMEKFDNAMFEAFGHRVGEYGIRAKVGEKHTSQGDCTKVFLGKWFCSFFKHIRCLKNKSDNLGFPKIMENCNQSILESFFAGLFDSDGYNSMDKRNVCLSLIDSNFVSILKDNLQKFGYVIKVRKKERPGYCPCYNLSFVGLTSLKILSEIPSIKIQAGNLYGKYDRLKTPYRCKSIGLNPNLYTDINGDDPLSDTKYTKYTNTISDLYIQKVESIKQQSESITYDITVDSDDHLFTAQSIILKNSGRIPAMLFSISCDHPDVEEFIQVKSDYTKIQNANISVQCTDKFYRAVTNDEDWELSFTVPSIKKGDKIYVDVHSVDMNTTKEKETGRYYRLATHDRKKEVFSKTVKARKLMELIAKNMHTNAEPGIQNIDIARKYSNSDALYDEKDEYDSRIIGTNACSEQYLSRESLCVLASINCGKFSTKQEIYMTQLDKVGHSINRFLDNVNECELVHQTYATPHQALAIKKLRRTGTGVTNIAAWLFKKNLAYGTKDGNDAVEEFIKWYNYWLYISTEELGLEKGDFGLFNKEKWRNAPFVQRMMKLSEQMNADYKTPVLKGTHARNVTVSSIAPTGTLSLMFRDFVLSYGIEPAFFMYFWKRTRMAGKYEYYFCVPRVIRDAFAELGCPIPMDSDCIRDTWDGKHGKPIAAFIEEHRHKFKFKESVDISAMDKLELMAKTMKWIDSSISVTYMLPLGSTWKDVYNFILEAHKKEVKSIAAFPDKKMYGIVSSFAFKDLAFKLKNEGINIHHQNFSDDEIKELNISRESVQAIAHVRPERPSTLDADIHVVTAKGDKFVMVIGILNGKPYEMFGGHINGFGFKFQTRNGKMRKVKSDQYALEINDIEIEDFSKQFTSTEQILFRFVSLSLGSGLPIQEIVDQLQKGAMDITSLGAAAARVLKKYIKNGTVADGKKCPSCQTQIVFIDGCCSCPNCEWSQCT